MRPAALPIVLGLIGLSAARTDLDGCVSSRTTNQWHEASMIWYVPDSGEICDIPDCGGGRAPSKPDAPGCGSVSATPSYLPGWGPSGKLAATTSTVSQTTSTGSTHTTGSADTTASTSSSAGSMVTAAPTISVSMSTKTSMNSASGSSTSSAPTSSSTDNAAVTSGSNIAAALGVAAVLGAIAL
ncbi:hypothetical protein N7492_009121 [Penicillium capsulatum]|uniref:Siderophore biosynthesis enzyme n=1 Tax=Penicillium capsulatum TaxID=69766 RepID=A0A9W9HTF1_9EURO|nr:hypothetical protein N7492_009121 [Penicillium capsulatum]KAJ6106520.1 hypothetical protein N7512_010037 [Penicillium capsulatum]